MTDVLGSVWFLGSSVWNGQLLIYMPIMATTILLDTRHQTLETSKQEE